MNGKKQAPYKQTVAKSSKVILKRGVPCPSMSQFLLILKGSRLNAWKVRRAEPWTDFAECYGSVASIRRITSLYPPYNSSLVGGLRLKERKAKSKSHSFLVRSPTNKVRLCERSEPQSNRLLDKPGLDEASSRFLMEIAF